MVWVRKGFCLQCGRCCNINNWVIQGDTVPNGEVVFLNNGNCEYLVDGRCSINDTKPEICKLSPRHPDDMKHFIYKDICGFYFSKK